MTRDLPFLTLADALERLDTPLQSQNPDRTRPGGSGSPDVPADRIIEAALKAVQTGFPHLSMSDIASPPHQWFDAALARQIALHILVHRFGFSRKQLVRELGRSREAMNRALRTVDERLIAPEFEDSYEAMALHAKAELEERD